ncbi:MAG: ATP synthase subunit C [Planctomycetota bacterium]|jgi:V/A-type H+-transporting ATPase subunit K
MDKPCRKLKTQITESIIVLFTVMAIVGTIFCTNAFAGTSLDEESVEPEMSSTKASVMKYALVAAAVAFGLGALGAGFAISHVGAAAMGAVAEKPEIGSQALLFIALAEGLVVFGFITSILILNKV